MGLSTLEKQQVKVRSSELLARNWPKYASMVYVLDGLSKINPGLVLAYNGGREVDDVVDGDKPLPVGTDTVDQYIDQIKTDLKNCDPLSDEIQVDDASTSFLFLHALKYLIPLEDSTLGDDATSELISFVEVMRSEYHRRDQRRVLTASEVLQSYWDGFRHAQNITLMSMGSRVRVPERIPGTRQALEQQSGDFPFVLPLILGKSYAIRDLQGELAMGICNIPSEVIELSGLSAEDLMSNPKLAKKNSYLKVWSQNEITESKFLAKRLKKSNLDKPARLLVNFLTFPIVKPTI